jgi:ABC-type transport system involved in multi-copper enzyme maturation permease subunit
LIVLFALIVGGLIVLTLSLDLEVVDGAIAAGKLFGQGFMGAKDKVDAAAFLRPLMSALAYLVFYGGSLFLVVAVADIAPKMVSPGRVELMLALPIRRHELVLGIYVGVMIIALLAADLAIGGTSAVLFIKTEIVTPAPLMGALTAMVGFIALYGVMLAVSVIARSPALAAGFAILIYGVGIATSDRALVLKLIRNPVTREIAAVAMGPLPRMRTLADIGGDVGVGNAVEWAHALPVIGGCVAFGFFFVALACVVVSIKDY